MKKRYLLLSLAFFLVSLFFAAQTYSRYYRRINVTSTTIYTAAWHFEANDSTTSFTTNLGDLYPGINRSFDINLSSVGSEVPVDYTITFNNPVNVPTKLIFYEDFAKQHSINLNGGTITGTLNPNSAEAVTVYYDWAYEGAEEALSGSATFNITIFGRQQNPNS